MFDDLKKYSEEHSDRFKVRFTLSKPPKDKEWPYDVGHLDEKLIKDNFYPPDGSKIGTFLSVAALVFYQGTSHKTNSSLTLLLL